MNLKIYNPTLLKTMSFCPKIKIICLFLKYKGSYKRKNKGKYKGKQKGKKKIDSFLIPFFKVNSFVRN